MVKTKGDSGIDLCLTLHSFLVSLVFKKIISFINFLGGCAGSSFLYGLFSSCGEWGLLITVASLVSPTSLVAQMVKHLWVRALGWEDPLEKEMAIHSSTVA